MNCLLGETASPSSASNNRASPTVSSKINNCNSLNIKTDSNSTPLIGHTMNSQEPCLICGDVASGKHYGLRSCEACKAFFKRTVQGKIEYSCPASRECEINKRRRKACQACRFQKCLDMGMLKEGVRLDRVRGGRQKYRRLASVGSTSCDGISSGASRASGLVGSGSIGQQSIGQQSSSMHSLEPNLGTSATSRIMTALINCEPEELTASPAQVVSNIPATLAVQMKTLYILSDLFDRELVSLIGWAKQIPGFSETLTLNDQMRLLQSTWAEVMALSIGYRSHLKRIENYRQQYGTSSGSSSSSNQFLNATPSPTSSSPASTASTYNNINDNNNNNNNSTSTEIRLVFAKDLIIDFRHAVACGAEDIFYNCVQLIKRLEYLKITPKEYIILKAISLTNADVRLENPKATHQLRDLIMDTLYEATIADHGSNGAREVINQRLNQVLLCLPVLRQIDSCIRKFWNDVRKGPNSVPMNKLFEEMLEPKVG